MKIIPGGHQDVGRRKDQQDAFWFSDYKDAAFVAHGGALAIVADGMGGLEKGSEASQLAVTTFGRRYLSKSKAQTVPEALYKAFWEANNAVCQLSRRVDDSNNVGTTLVAAVIANGQLHWIAAGDSRLYVLRRGELTQLTIDHNYSEVLRQQVSSGELSPEEAAQHPDRNSLTSYLGMPDLEEIDRSIGPFILESGDWVLLCSDGLHGTLTEAEIIAELHGVPLEAADRLIQRTLAKNLTHQDNVTVAIMSYESSKAAGSVNGKGEAQGIWEEITDFFLSRRAVFVALGLLAVAAFGMAASRLVERLSPQPPNQIPLAIPKNGSTPPKPEGQSSVSDTDPKKDSQDDAAKIAKENHDQIEKLMESARKNMAANHISGPSEALENYEAVLNIDPDYSAAREGLQEIRDKLLKLAEEAKQRKDATTAEKHWKNAKRAEAALSRSSELIEKGKEIEQLKQKQKEEQEAARRADAQRRAEAEAAKRAETETKRKAAEAAEARQKAEANQKAQEAARKPEAERKAEETVPSKKVEGPGYKIETSKKREEPAPKTDDSTWSTGTDGKGKENEAGGKK